LDEDLRDILETAHTIAVVGLSSSPGKESYRVAAYLKHAGYRLIPVNPSAQEILGERSYPNLEAIPEPVDVVQIFRPSEQVGPIVEQAVRIGAGAVWMQLGIINESAADIAHDAGLKVVMNRCMKVEHRRMIAGLVR
jgi:predicted CoA-binding protein